jgi:hypothetical protein
MKPDLVTAKPKSSPTAESQKSKSVTKLEQETTTTNLQKPKKKKPVLTTQSTRGVSDESSRGEGTGHVTALWIVCKKKIAADEDMIGVEKMLGNLPDLTGMTADKLKMTLMTSVLQKSPGDIAQYSNVLGQLARARLAVMENRTDGVDVDAAVPRFIYSLINTVVLLHPSGAALGGVATHTQLGTELAYMAGVLKHSFGLAGLVESAEQGQMTEPENKKQKHSGGSRRGSAPTIFVREDDVGKKSSSRSGRSPDGKASEKRSGKKSGGHDDQNETLESTEKPRGDGKSKKDKVKRIRSEDSDMGPPSPKYIVASPPPESPPPSKPIPTVPPLTMSPSSAPPPYSPPAYSPQGVDDDFARKFNTTAATSTASSTSTTSAAAPALRTDLSHLALAASSPPVSPRPTTLGSARPSMKIENLDRFMENNIKKFEKDMGERGSSLMLRVVKRLPADYELNASNSEALTGHAGDALDSAALSDVEMKELAGLNPKVYKNNPRANHLSLMQLLIVNVARGRLEGGLISVKPSPSQERVNLLMASILSSFNEQEFTKLLDADLMHEDDDVGMLSPGAPSMDGLGVSTGSSLARSNSAAFAESITPREPVANYRKGTSVPPSPRGVSRESSGEDKAGLNGTSTGKFGSLPPTGKERSSEPVSRESSGSDLEDSVGETTGEKNAISQEQRLRSGSQRNLMQQSAPRKLTTHKRTNTATPLTTPPNSPEKGSPGKTPESGLPEQQQ